MKQLIFVFSQDRTLTYSFDSKSWILKKRGVRVKGSPAYEQCIETLSMGVNSTVSDIFHNVFLQKL